MLKKQLASKSKKFSQAGFGIIESLIALAAISVVVVAVNKQFLGTRENTAIRKARAMFDADMVRLMMVTEENNLCEKLNILGLKMPGLNGKIELDRIKYGDEVLIERHALKKSAKSRKALYRIKSIKLVQTSSQFGITPKRARAAIELEASFWSTQGVELKMDARKEVDSKGTADIIIVATDGSTIDSCYGIYSRRIACTDENKTYDPEGKPSCH